MYESNINLPLPTPSLYGGVGLLDMRTARFMPDGTIALNVAIKSPDDRIAFTFQALPWLEATFRYSINYALAPIGQRALYDRSFDLKARLWEEGLYMPEIAIGLQDFIGTGVYSAEYVAASKRFGPVDLSMGMGWGRLASRPAFENPFCAIYATFCTRSGDTTGTGGSFLATDWFRGENVGIFGGIEYNTPIPDLTLKVEYSTDSYAAESAYRHNPSVTPKNYAPVPVNAGLDYRVFGDVDLGVAVIGGREISFDASIAIDPTKPNWPYRLDPPPPFVARPPASSGAITPLPLNTNATPAPPAQFINLDAFNQSEGRPPDPSLLASPEYRVVEAFRKSGLVVTDGWITGNALVARVGTVGTTLPPCATLRDATNFDNVVLVSDDWNPLETCSDAAAANPAVVASAATPQLSPASATESWQPDTLGKMRRAIEEQHLIVQGITIAAGVVKVQIENDKYFRDSEAISRTARALSASAPPEIGAFQVTTTTSHMPLTTVTIPRSQVDALAHGDGTAGELWSSSVLSDASPATHFENGASNPQFSWSIFPTVQTQLFDPNNPAYIGIGISGATRTELFPGLVLDNEATYGIWDNFGSITRPNNSQLPPVRTDIVSYLQKGFTGINDLTLTDYVKPASEVYARLTVGYIEQMFAGVGGEVLYRPFGQRWALGADIFDVYQRNFDDLFGLAHLCPVYPAPLSCPAPLQTYNVWTGHASLYVETPWHDVTAVVRAGRYLAGDYGGTLELYRRFDTGIIVGAWMTFTNVSASKFGEGSFDKGIRIVIPTEFVLPFGTTTRFEEDLRPIQRDGGQILNNDAILYDMTQSSSYGDLERQWPHLFP